MDIQIALNWLLSIIVMGFTSIMIIDFVNGLFELPYTRAMAVPTLRAIAAVTTNSQALALQQEPAAPIPEPAITPDPWTVPQFEQLPDPWELTTEIAPTEIQQEPVVLQLSTLKLLPPAAQLQPKARATKKSTTKPKSTTTSKTSKPTPAVTPRKSRKKVAA